MIEIPLTQNKVAFIDDGDAASVSGRKWFAVQTHVGIWYAATKASGRLLYMHRLLVPGAMTDHRDGNGLNNQRFNLRQCNSAQNSFNRKKMTGTSSKFKGVSWSRRERRWIAQIEKDGKNRRLGAFADEEQAADSYRTAASELFGEFARV